MTDTAEQSSEQLAEQLYEKLLVLRCQTGDERAVAELVERFHARLRYYVRKMLPELDQADDILQEVWFDVYRKLPQLREPGAFRAWLYRIARDRVYVVLRRRRPTYEPLAECDLAEAAYEEEELTPEDARRVHEALAKLPPDQREVLVLRFLEEMSYEDIARVSDSPLGTVRSRLHYAKRALRLILEKDRCYE